MRVEFETWELVENKQYERLMVTERHFHLDLQVEENQVQAPHSSTVSQKQCALQFAEELAQSTVSIEGFLEGKQDRDV